MSIFDDLIKNVPAEDRTILDKYPDLKTTVDALEEGGRKYATWYANNWDREHDMTKSEFAARQEAEELRKKIEAAPPVSDMDPNDLAQLKTELEQKVKDAADGFGRTISGMDRFYSRAYYLGFQHKDEFGQPMDPQVLLKFMGDNQIQDPDAAYERMVSKQRSDRAAAEKTALEAKHAQDILDAEKRGADAARQEQTMGPQGMLPTDNIGGIVGVTSIPPSGTIPKETLDRTAGMKLSDPALAVAGLEALRKGQLPVQ